MYTLIKLASLASLTKFDKIWQVGLLYKIKDI